jgi:NAD(P)-dependent dehydrogenase (short-subunit alcohol dehydrogenase family)/uncharacterized OB-fold protein
MIAMNETIKRPERRNPILKTRAPTLPPDRRSRVALGLVRAAAQGHLELQCCAACGAVQYPPREACVRCLSGELEWTAIRGDGELISETTLRHSQELFFRERAPRRLGLVRLSQGVSMVVHLDARCGPAPCAVRVETALDRAGQAVLVAVPADATAALADEPKLRDMTSDPRFRKVLVTDAKSPAGQAVVRAVIGAGVDMVWAGHCEPWKNPPGWSEIADLPNTTLVPLDVTDTKSVNELAAELGFKVDIVINTAEHHRTFGLFGRTGVETAKAEMETNCFGLMRLAQAFGPIMQARAADGDYGAVAWVNLLSIYALSSYPQQATYSASMAAALSVAQALRAEMHSAGIRVINIFPGPIDDEWSQLLLPPKLSPSAVARAIVDALKGSVEDVYPGDIAQDWLARFRDNPKALEREIGQ